MLHTKPQGHWQFDSGEEDFQGFFYHIYGHSGFLGHVTQMQQINFHYPYPLRIHLKFGFDWPSGLWGEDVWSVFPIYESM